MFVLIGLPCLGEFWVTVAIRPQDPTRKPWLLHLPPFDLLAARGAQLQGLLVPRQMQWGGIGNVMSAPPSSCSAPNMGPLWSNKEDISIAAASHSNHATPRDVGRLLIRQAVPL